MHMRLARFLSHVWPVRVQRAAGTHGTLELTWEYGRLVVNSANANQSFGSLHRVWRAALRDAGIQRKEPRTALVLGYGAGSVAHILLKRVLDTTPITPNQVTVSRLIISGVTLLLLQAVFGTPGDLPRGLADPDFQRAAFVMGFAYYLELIIWFYAIRHIEVSVASSVTVPAPAVTMLIAVTLLGQEVARYQVLAMMVIGVAMYGLLFAGKLARASLRTRAAVQDRPNQNRP